MLGGRGGWQRCLNLGMGEGCSGSETDEGASGEFTLTASGKLWALLFWEALSHWSYTSCNLLLYKVLSHHVFLKTRMVKMREMGKIVVKAFSNSH